MKYRQFGSAFTLIVVLLLSLGQTSIVSSQACNLDSIMANEVGTFRLVPETATSPMVYLIEEQHDLVTAQVESALMIHRLIRDCGVRPIGLEGAFPDTPFDTRWFRGFGYETYAQVAVQQLGAGEINQGEFAALIYPDLVDGFQIAGIDNRALYQKPIPDAEFGSITIAMLFTGLANLDENQLTTALDIFDESPPDDASEEEFDAWRKSLFEATFANNPDPAIVGWYEATNVEEGVIVPVEADIENIEMAIGIVQSHQTQTEELLGQSLDPFLADAQVELQFDIDTHARSVTMVQEIEKIAAATASTPVTAIIGAAHTEWMAQTLAADGLPVAVLTPLSVTDTSVAVSIPTELYGVKSQGGSIDLPGQLGALLAPDAIKPPVVINQPWHQPKSAIQSYAMLVTLGLRDNPQATLAEILQDAPTLSGVTVAMDSLEAVPDLPGRYTFRIDLNVAGVNRSSIYVGVATDLIDESRTIAFTEDNMDDLERLLIQKLDTLREQAQLAEQAEQAEQVEQASTNLGDGASRLQEVGGDVLAAFGTTQADVVEALHTG